jgi:HlyD family secretion protein
MALAGDRAMSVDLEVLRQAPQAPAAPARRRGGLAVGIVLVAGALAWAALLLKDSFVPARRVATAPVVVETGGAARRTTAFDATGWVEPDPFPIHVRPLVEGVVERIEVVEGDVVEAGKTVLARLRNVMLEAEVETMEKEVAHKAAHVPVTTAEREEAARALELKTELRAEVAALEAEERSAVAERAEAEAAVDVAAGAVAEVEAELAAQRALGASGLALSLAKAQAALETARAEHRAKRASVGRGEAAVEGLRARLAIAREAAEHAVALKGALARAEGHEKSAIADLELHRTKLEAARRSVALLKVVAPVDGVVLERKAGPGSSVGPVTMRGGADMGGPAETGDLLDLYDPKRLQVRVVVPIASVGAVGRGQAVELSMDALPGKTFRGEVVRLTSLADRANNTLEVKVRIAEPDPLMRPEMVVRARFLAPQKAAGDGVPGPARLLVPERALRGDAVFVLDPRRGGRARRVAVVRVAQDGDRVEVTGDLSATHRVILDVVEDGERVKDEDAS